MGKLKFAMQPVFMFEDEYLDVGQEVIVVRAEMTPILIETMTKFDDDHDVSFLKSYAWV